MGRSRPKFPKTVDEWAKQLESGDSNIGDLAKYYVGQVGDNLIFSHPYLMSLCPEIKSILADGHFWSVPKLFYQMWTLYGEILEHSFPLFVCLAKNKETQTYLCLLQRIKELVPGFDPEKGMSDFEQAEWNALLEAFPDLDLTGCWFHFCQVPSQFHF